MTSPANEGFVSVGISADTAQFSVASILAWWRHLGEARYPDATRLTIDADCGGSNSYRTRFLGNPSCMAWPMRPP